MVARGEIAGISAGYQVDEWEIADADGRIIEPDRVRWDDDGLTFTATRWRLLEASLVSVPADGSASIRSLGSGSDRPMPEIDELARRATRITKQFGDASITYELRSQGGGANSLSDIRARVEARHAMAFRQLEHHLLELELIEQERLRADGQLIGGARAEAWRKTLGLF
jgi:hypothetical protein